MKNLKIKLTNCYCTKALKRLSEFGICYGVLVLGLIAWPFSAMAVGGGSVDISTSWFRPTLAINQDASICGPLLDGYTNSFATTQGNPLESSLERYESVRAASKIIEKKLHKIAWEELSVGEEKLKIANFSASGKHYAIVRRDYSIGWREGFHHEILISKPFAKYRIAEKDLEPFFEANSLGTFTESSPKVLRPMYEGEKNQMATGGAAIYADFSNLFQAGSAAYLVFKLPNSYIVLRLDAPDKMTLTCRLETTPTPKQLVAKMAELPTVTALTKTLNSMMGSECNGGTMHALSNAQSEMNEVLSSMLFRPWVLNVVERTNYESVEYGYTQEGVARSLEQWGYSGIWEYEQYKNYITQAPVAQKELQSFFVRNFRLKDVEASHLARTAISDAIVTGFDHGYNVDASHELHKKILTGKITQTTIEAIELSPRDPDRPHGESDENLLTFAILQPRVLEKLLNSGVDPNEPNWFGKTPLMYAAQFNQMKSVQLLLAHGARVEPYTVRNFSSCIDVNHLTALHYGARYASKDFVKLLVKHGAIISAQDTKGHTAMDYLTEYENPKLTTADKAELKTLLKSPDAASLKSISKMENQTAENLYREGKVDDAYIALKRALTLNEANDSALANLALVALKLGKLGESASVSSKLAAATRSDEIRANAYFNLGVACRKGRWIDYDGVNYCNVDHKYQNGQSINIDRGALSSFLSSYELKPTKNRLEAILGVFEKTEGRYRNCKFPANEMGIHALHFSEPNLYFLIDANKNASFGNVSGTYSNGTSQIQARNKRSASLNDKLKIEVWDVGSSLGVPVFFDNFACAPMLANVYDKQSKIVGVFRPPTKRSGNLGESPARDGLSKELNIVIESTTPTILFFYGHDYKYVLTGNLSKVQAVFIHGHSTVTLPEGQDIQIVKEAEKDELSAWASFGAEDQYGAKSEVSSRSKYLLGLPVSSFINLGTNDTVKIDDKLTAETAVHPK